MQTKPSLSLSLSLSFSQEEMNNWITRIKQALPGSPTKVQTLPARLEGEKSEPKQKRGFFTLKKK